MKDKMLIIGSSGQIGIELVIKLRELYGIDSVIASDINMGTKEFTESGPFELLDVMDASQLLEIVKKHNTNQIYNLAALLSATAEKNPQWAWKLNMEGLFNVLELAKEGMINKVFWPSSIAVFGPNTPKENTPQFTITEPNTVYGISKLAGERWCEYYNQKYNVDVKSVRFPGLIGYKSQPCGGTTDYAVHIFHEAIKNKYYDCFLSQNSTLPMMYMPDAIDATIQLMETKVNNLSTWCSYNIAGVSFSPKELANEIKKHIPNFTITYNSDERQKIANGWPSSIDDSFAKQQWGWAAKFNIEKITENMLENIN